jgi:hypothetical protein
MNFDQNLCKIVKVINRYIFSYFVYYNIIKIFIYEMHVIIKNNYYINSKYLEQIDIYL